MTARWLTVSEIRTLYSRPMGTIYRLASVNRWRKLDNRKPALYRADDVEATFSAMTAPVESVTCVDCRYGMHGRCDDLNCSCCP